MYYPIISYFATDTTLGDVVAFQSGSTTNITNHSVASWTQMGGNGLTARGAVDCAYSPLLQVMCAIAGDTDSDVSADAGQTWSSGSTPVVGTGWSGIAWNGTVNEFHATGIGAAGSATSSDGLTWSHFTTATFDASTCRPIWIPTYGTTVVTVGHNINIADTPRFFSSSDGATWVTTTPFAVGEAFGGVAWGGWVGGSNGRLIALTRRKTAGGFPRKVYYSDNGGSTWSSTSSYAQDIDYSRVLSVRRLSLFVAIAGDNAVAGAGTTSVVYSADGINWSLASMPYSEKWADVMDTGEKLIAVPNSVASASTCAVSLDGMTWSAGPSMANSGIAWKALGCTREIQLET